jgi:hypothetical protein
MKVIQELTRNVITFHWSITTCRATLLSKMPEKVSPSGRRNPTKSSAWQSPVAPMRKLPKVLAGSSRTAAFVQSKRKKISGFVRKITRFTGCHEVETPESDGVLLLHVIYRVVHTGNVCTTSNPQKIRGMRCGVHTVLDRETICLPLKIAHLI